MNSDYSLNPTRQRNIISKEIFSSPTKKTPTPKTPKSAIYSDRFIPQRQLNSINESLIADELFFSDSNPASAKKDESFDQEDSTSLYSSLLQMQILSDSNQDIEISESLPGTPTKKSSFNVLKFKSPKRRRADFENQLNLSPFKEENFQPLKGKQPSRKISRIPYKILDAPALVDDYYLNLLDWGSSNLVSIGLDNTVHIWSAVTNKAYKLYEIPSNEMICSVAWNHKADILAVGDTTGKLKLLDPETGKVVREMAGHTCRVGSIAWNGNIVSTGSRDKSILTRDVRVSENFIYKLNGHKQEICGLKWSFDENTLASGGNDNKIVLWSHKTQGELARFTEHVAAVKALAWSPHQHNILASGGGKSDKTIKIWNLHSLKRIESLDTGSQVCNMMFSTNSNELITTHGYSMNEVCIWSYPSLQKLATLTGHASRVLYLGMSPDGENVVTGAGDETLRFWNVFPSKKNQNDDMFDRCVLKPSSLDLR